MSNTKLTAKMEEDKDGWTDFVALATSPTDYLVSVGLSGEDANAIIDAAGINSFQDFRLMDDSMISEVAKEVGLKLIPAKKFSIAIQALLDKNNNNKNDLETNKKNSREDPDTSKKEVTKEQIPPNDDSPDECIVVAIDRSGSMGCDFEEAPAFGPNAEKTLTHRSRQDAVKQCFYAFRDRTETLGTKHHLGLIQFDNKIEEMLALTPDLDKFESVVDYLRPRGATAIYSAILLACQMLEESYSTSNKTNLRVLVLTDGQNNAGATPQEALRAVQKIDAVVDAILVGNCPDENLLKIVKASGGSCFQIYSLSDGFELMEAESVVSLHSRWGGGDRPPKEKLSVSSFVDFPNIPAQTIIHSSQAASAASTSHASSAMKKPVKLVSCRNISNLQFDSVPKKGGIWKRIAKEIAEFDKGNGCKDQMNLYQNENNQYQFKVLSKGPKNSPFEDGIFVLDIILPCDYPFKPPKITFETPIYHCNVSSSGQICLDILQQDQWSPRYTIKQCLQEIQELMIHPNPKDAIRLSIAEFCFAHQKLFDKRYVTHAKAATLKNASKTVEEWEKEWGVQGKS